MDILFIMYLFWWINTEYIIIYLCPANVCENEKDARSKIFIGMEM